MHSHFTAQHTAIATTTTKATATTTTTTSSPPTILATKGATRNRTLKMQRRRPPTSSLALRVRPHPAVSDAHVQTPHYHSKRTSRRTTPTTNIRRFCCSRQTWPLLIALAAIIMPFQHSVAIDLRPESDAAVTLYRVAPADELGIYKYAYSTSNGIAVQTAGSELEQIGIFSYTAPEGVKIEVRYIADELGFHAVGRHLPRPPPIPDYILRSLEYIRTHPNAEHRIGAGKYQKQ